MKLTEPISFSGTDIWVFADFGDEVQAGRLAVSKHGAFVVFPEAHFAVNGRFPIYPDTDKRIPGMRWASTIDIAENPHVFCFDRQGRDYQ